MRKLFKNARLIFEPGRSPQEGFLSEQDGWIRRLELRGDHPGFERLTEEESVCCDEVIDCEGDYLSPGFIDLHCHGGFGRDAMEATSEAFDAILSYHATRGTTLSVLTTVAATLEEMVSVLSTAEIYRKGAGGARFAGIHLEGPYFSPMRRGAHRPELLRYPNPGETRELLRHRGVISRMSLASELPGALELIGEFVRHGISVSAGHSDASEEEARMGFEAGVTQVTHLYNCMSSLRHERGRRVTGLAEAALTTRGVVCEVIADGKHLPATLLRLAWLAKGWEEVAIVSDATGGAGLPEGAAFELGGLSCRIEQGAAWTGEGEARRLAGSSSGMIDGVRVMVEQAKAPLQEAVAMATLVPARALRLQEERGSLATGKRADLLRFSEEWRVRGVWAAGRRIH